MAEMTTRERMVRMYEHREADRVPVVDYPWDATFERWHREGMPTDADYVDYFGLDKFADLNADNGPRYPETIVEETDEWVIRTTDWGATLREWKHAEGVPGFLDAAIKDPASWAEAKGRMTPTPDRVGWEWLKSNYSRLREEGAWITANFWFGFDVLHSWVVGTERLLLAMVEQPEWVVDMLDHSLDVQIALFELVWEAGYHFDAIAWCDDMGYKHSQFFSLDMYRQLVKPSHKRAADWAHAKGLKVNLHSCGYIAPLVPDLIDAGIDMLNPLEVKAGMDPIHLKAQYGDVLAFQGGLNAVLFDQPDSLWREMRRVVPHMKRNGGYVLGSDHSVPSSTSLETFRRFVTLAKELGSYQ